MNKIIFTLLLAVPMSSFAQYGVKAGLNFANVTNASSVNSSSRTGFHVGAFMAPPSKGIFGSRTEIIYSRQGYNYKTGTNTGNVNLDYIVLPQYLAINITKYVQIHVGGQIAYLLNAKVDSSKSTGNPMADKVMSMYNRFDYGYGGGVEVHPISGLLIGARVNISLGDLYKNPASTSGGFAPKVDIRNNVFQVFAGWRFGRHGNSSSKSAPGKGYSGQ
jgi:hypothetical protein